MGDSYGDPQQNTRNFESNRDSSRGGFRTGRGSGGRGPGGREGGGFRIRLSDNEMRSARSLQEAFNLRSTVAVLGFSVRTLAQMLEEGKLDELIAQSRTQGSPGANRRSEGRQGSRRNRFNEDNQTTNRGEAKPNPFARPEKPQPVVEEAEGVDPHNEGTDAVDTSSSEANIDDLKDHSSEGEDTPIENSISEEDKSSKEGES